MYVNIILYLNRENELQKNKQEKKRSSSLPSNFFPKFKYLPQPNLLTFGNTSAAIPPINYKESNYLDLYLVLVGNIMQKKIFKKVKFEDV